MGGNTRALFLDPTADSTTKTEFFRESAEFTREQFAQKLGF
jgi:hypothetical protein